MYLPVCVLVHVICLNLVSCQSTGYKCENSCDNGTGGAVPYQKAANSSDAFWRSGNQEVKPVEVVKLILKKALMQLRKIWNSERVLKFSVFPNGSDGGGDGDDVWSVKFLRDANDVTADGNEAGRTFGIRRRMQLLLFLPISFKLGVIMTLLLVLTTMSLKTLIIGFIILFLLLANTHTYSKLWGAPKKAELTDFYHHSNTVPVHVHLHTAVPEDHHRPTAYIEHQSPSAAYVYQRSWQESPAASVGHR